MNIPSEAEVWVATVILILLVWGIVYGVGLVVVDQIRKWWGGK